MSRISVVGSKSSWVGSWLPWSKLAIAPWMGEYMLAKTDAINNDSLWLIRVPTGRIAESRSVQHDNGSSPLPGVSAGPS